jgi:hypothetical protein
MGQVKFDTIAEKQVAIGNNKYETGTINMTAGQTIKAGQMLSRLGDDSMKWVLATTASMAQGHNGAGVMPFDLTNEGSATANIPFRALVGGDVRKDMLIVNGGPAGIYSSLLDYLRDYGIVAVDMTDMSRASP